MPVISCFLEVILKYARNLEIKSEITNNEAAHENAQRHRQLLSHGMIQLNEVQ
jgi:D-ribose pyranose/furanose isomerase RbsD